MENISLEKIKLLRDSTGAGVMECKKALTDSQGNFDNAISLIKEKGIVTATKKISRETKQGIVFSYIHTGSKIGVLIELNCETDFVARRKEFQLLAKTIAMQIASFDSIKYISFKDISQEEWDLEIAIESKKEDMENKPNYIKEIIIKERVEKKFKSFTLLNQPYIYDLNISLEDYIKNNISLLGENIKINRFSKFVVGN